MVVHTTTTTTTSKSNIYGRLSSRKFMHKVYFSLWKRKCLVVFYIVLWKYQILYNWVGLVILLYIYTYTWIFFPLFALLICTNVIVKFLIEILQQTFYFSFTHPLNKNVNFSIQLLLVYDGRLYVYRIIMNILCQLKYRWTIFLI